MMNQGFHKILEAEPVSASAPCRIDMGGTLDISSFYYPLAYVNPCTFNISMSLRTQATIFAFQKGWIKISSKGFESAQYPVDQVPFRHSMGLMFAIAAYFQIDGIHIQIESASPPRSALGGSSVAAVALIAAFNQLLEKSGRSTIPQDRIALLAHGIEESVAGVPCGLQDQLAAVYGGVNAWFWKGAGSLRPYARHDLSASGIVANLSDHLLVAYCGMPHESKNINGIWVNRFINGETRNHWVDIARCTSAFVEAFATSDVAAAVAQLNRETEIRVDMTPDVLDETGRQLVGAARNHHCGARFTGAGGGGCVWALGDPDKIAILKPAWEKILAETPSAALLDMVMDAEGLRSETV
ncbi:MAG: galactokinase [Desulfosalsimonadaceae bacterium]|nr:galactokinase [Desulfosalsimonadaceae bacterium]